MERVKLTPEFDISRLVHGHWRLMDWNKSDNELLKLTEQVVEMGITSFDHADIYGNYSCEEKFGKCLQLKPSLRKNIQIITKCGIKLISDKFPGRKINSYDYSYKHIIESVENSLRHFHTDYIDLLLLHRPSPFFDPEEVAKAFSDLQQKGKVLHFGVSNFTPLQYEMLDAYCDVKLVTNQVEISPYCLEHFENGNIDFFLKEKIKPMAWSPLAGGNYKNVHNRITNINNVIFEIAEELNIHPIEEIIYAWLINHPASIIPVLGTGKPERIKLAIEALEISLSTEQWLRIYIASRGEDLP